MDILPEELMIDIVRRVGAGGFRELAPLMAAGPELLEIVRKPEVLSEVDIDEYIFVGFLANEDSQFRGFFQRCLHAGNVTAKYVEGLRLLCQYGPCQVGLDLIGEASSVINYALLAYGIFLICCGCYEDGMEVTNLFLQQTDTLLEAVEIADTITMQIGEMGTRRVRPFRGYMHWLGRVPFCNLDHWTSLDICPACFAFTYALRYSGMC